jgi:1-acyl-sn-glycerol-3-phosphate acyltransferase
MVTGKSLSRGAILFSTILGALANFVWLRARLGRRAIRTERSQWLHKWCKVGLRRLDIGLVVYGTLPPSGLVVSNHLSYLDILLFSAAQPCIFVSKSEVRSWPVFGWLASLGGTIYVDRQRRSETPRVHREMEEALSERIPVILFPEGTSSDGSLVLPFRSALFEPVVELNLDVTPAHVSYTLDEGSVATDVCYWGDMTLIPHLFNMLSKGKITGRIRFSSRPATYSNRKEAATLARAEVVTLAAEAAREDFSVAEAAAACSRLQMG